MQGTASNMRWATHAPGRRRTSRAIAFQSPVFMAERMLTVSPVLQNADFSSQLSSLSQDASRGSRVSGNKQRQMGNGVCILFQANGNLLLSEIMAQPGFTTGVFPPRKNW